MELTPTSEGEIYQPYLGQLVAQTRSGGGRKKGGGCKQYFPCSDLAVLQTGILPCCTWLFLLLTHPSLWVAALCTSDCTCKERFVNLLTASVGSYRRKNAARPPGEPKCRRGTRTGRRRWNSFPCVLARSLLLSLCVQCSNRGPNKKRRLRISRGR